MTAFPKYPAYKPSGVEWLGDVPEHWEISRSRRVFTQRKELARKDDQQLSATQAYGVIPQADYEERIGRSVVKISMHLEKRKHVEPDDFVISMRSFQGGLERAWARGAIRSSYTVLEPAIKVAPSYFAYLFKCPQYIGALQATGNFIRDGQDLTYQNYILVDLPLPPLPEQERIGAFLDEKTAEIDRLIAKKQRQIELLDEQKVILINRAVTRGLHPHTELQDSGIPWIGPIPKGWKVVALRRLLSEPLTNGLFKTKQFFGEGTRLVNVGDVYAQDNIINPSGLERVKANSREKASYQVLKGDIFFVRSSLKLEGTGASSMMPDCEEETVFECHVIRGRPKASVIDPEYLIRYLNAASVRSALVADAKTVTMSTLDQQAFLRLPVLVPPQEQQRPICDALRAMFEKFNQAKIQIESQIQTLQTLRSTLIAHAVTGKIKV